MNNIQSVKPVVSVEAQRSIDLGDVNQIKRGLLGLSVATAILASIPPFRLVGALTTRAIGLMATALDCTTIDSKTEAASKLSKVAIVGIGLVAVAVASPCLILASLISDLGLQSIEFVKAVKSGRGEEAPIYAAMATVDALILGATAAASSALMVTAAAVNAYVMFGFAIGALFRNKEPNGWESAAYCILATLSVVNLFQVIQHTERVKTVSHFDLSNDTKHTIGLIDRHGHNVGQTGPNESIAFQMPYKDTKHHTGIGYMVDGRGGIIKYPTQYGSYLDRITVDTSGTVLEMAKLNAVQVDSQLVVTKAGLPASTYPTLPMGGNVTVMTDYQG